MVDGIGCLVEEEEVQCREAAAVGVERVNSMSCRIPCPIDILPQLSLA